MPSHASLLHCYIMELLVLVLTGLSAHMKLRRITVCMSVGIYFIISPSFFKPKLVMNNVHLRKVV